MELSKENKQKMVFILEVAGIIGGICTFIALMLGPMFYLGNKIENFRKEFHEEVKDFHGRLCILEERSKR
jgi:hypothetical protein